jgi:hypothetical protein
MPPPRTFRSRRIANPLPRGRRPGLAFTIPELLIYSASSGLLLVAASATLLSSLRSNRNMEYYQRAEERWSRISSVIQSEVSEAQTVTYGDPVACGGLAAGVNNRSLFTLNIPYLDSNQARGQITIQYYRIGSGATAQLWRCGRPYAMSGKLRFTASNTDATAGLKTDIQIINPTSESFSFNLDIYSPDNQKILSRTASASVGVEPAVVCDKNQTVCNN